MMYKCRRLSFLHSNVVIFGEKTCLGDTHLKQHVCSCTFYATASANMSQDYGESLTLDVATQGRQQPTDPRSHCPSRLSPLLLPVIVDCPPLLSPSLSPRSPQAVVSLSTTRPHATTLLLMLSQCLPSPSALSYHAVHRPLLRRAAAATSSTA